MPDQNQVQLLAKALYEIRLLWAGHLGSASSSELRVRVAAHLAYALHNEAQAVVNGEAFNFEAEISQVRAVDTMFGESLANRLQSP